MTGTGAPQPGSGSLGVAGLVAAVAVAVAVAVVLPNRSRAVRDRLGTPPSRGTSRVSVDPVTGPRVRGPSMPGPVAGRIRALLARRVAAPHDVVGSMVVALGLAVAAVVAVVSWDGPARPAGRSGLGGPAAAAAAVLAAVTSHGVVAVLPAAAIATAFTLRAAHRSTRARAMTRVRHAVAEGVQVLASELRAGAPALDALRAASEVSPPLVDVARTAVLGGDVERALRRVAREPGTGGLRFVAAAWTVSAEMGSTLADTMDRLVDLLRSEDLARDETAAALAAPRATARLLCLLPLAGLGLGSSLGARPWQTLTGTSWGPAVTVVSVLLAGTGLEWVEHLAAGAEEPGGRSARGPRQRRSGPGGRSGTGRGLRRGPPTGQQPDVRTGSR